MWRLAVGATPWHPEAERALRQPCCTSTRPAIKRAGSLTLLKQAILKTCSRCRLEQQVSNFHVDRTRKDGRLPYCKPCKKAMTKPVTAEQAQRQSELSKERYAANRGAVLQRVRANYEANREKKLAEFRAYRRENSEKCAARVRAWVIAHPEQVNVRRQRWIAKNPAHHAATQSARRAHRKAATPAWADRKAILAVYEQARQARAAGYDVQVDHIVPLRSPLVCGLHVEANLVVIPRRENLAKSNRFTPG